MSSNTPAITGFDGNYRFLSNFHPCTVFYEGADYPTVEHAYQAAKTYSIRMRQDIRNCKTPGQAKRMGADVPLRVHWDNMKIEVMEGLIKQKFSHQTHVSPFGPMLLKTGDAELIEGNTWGDTFWGVCKGVGENHLGKIIMAQRTRLRSRGALID